MSRIKALDPYHAIITVQTRRFYRWYFTRVVLVELRARWIELSGELRRRDFYRRYYTGVVLPELLESPVYARLGREPTIVGLPEHAVWDYYLEEILPAVLDADNSNQPLEDPVEVQSPPSVDWDLVDRVERGESGYESSWTDIQHSRKVYDWEAELLEEYPDFWESWSPRR